MTISLQMCDSPSDVRSLAVSLRQSGIISPMARDVTQLLKLIEKAGCSIESGGKKHKCWLPGGTRFVIVSKTPSNQNFVNQVKADFKRHGIDLDQVSKEKRKR